MFRWRNSWRVAREKISLGLMLLLASFMIYFPLSPVVTSDPLPNSELQALNEYPNWVGSGGQCDGSSDCCSSSPAGPAGTGPLFGLTFPQVADTADLANRIDSYISKTVPTSPLAGLGAVFVAAGQKYNVNPALEVGIADKESTLGLNEDANSYDAWGLTAKGDIPDYPYDGTEYVFPSWTIGIYESTKYTSVTYVVPDATYYSTSVAQFMTHYTPDIPGVQSSAQQTQVTLGVMHDILDGIATQPGVAAVDTSTTSDSSTGCSTTDTLGTTTSPTTGSTINIQPIHIIQHDAFGMGDGPMGHQPTMIGLHFTGGNPQTPDDVVSYLMDPSGIKGCNHITHSCSVQLTVDPKGNVYQLTSQLNVITENIINFNDADIGIEIMGADEQTLLANNTQFDAVVSLVVQLMKQYNIQMVEDFTTKSGLMGHIECDDWSQAHLGTTFQGIYVGETVGSTDSHQDPGLTYMSNVRAAVGPALTQ